MSDEEPHEGQESATMHWILALESGASECGNRAECNGERMGERDKEESGK
jgi:hypothetical protein